MVAVARASLSRFIMIDREINCGGHETMAARPTAEPRAAVWPMSKDGRRTDEPCAHPKIKDESQRFYLDTFCSKV